MNINGKREEGQKYLKHNCKRQCELGTIILPADATKFAIPNRTDISQIINKQQCCIEMICIII